MNFDRGYMVEVLKTTASNNACVFPQFVWVEVTDREQADLLHFKEEWLRPLQFTVQNHNEVLDGYRIKVSVDPALVSAVSKLNALTREQVENFLTRWNATIYDASVPNEVIFDAGIYEAVCSTGFWNVNVSNVVFSQEYDQPSGVHTITADLSATSFIFQKAVARVINMLGYANFVSADPQTKQIVFTATGAIVREAFQTEVKDAFQFPKYRRKYYVTEAGMQIIEAGGVPGEKCIYTATFAQLSNYVHDRMLD